MNTEDAKVIKGWRVGGASWRRIAELASYMWPDRDYDCGNQIEGRELCLEAAKTLGEDYKSEDWK
jgi:hypothetical protein